MTDHNFDLPEMIEIEPTDTCNLRCRMCHVSYMPDALRPVLDTSLLIKLNCLKGRHFALGSSFEPMLHGGFVEIARMLQRLQAGVEIVTNATLLKGDAAAALADTDLRMFTISFDGIRKETYEHIRRRSDHAATLSNMQAFRARMTARDTYFACNSTMMRHNLDEIGAMIEHWDGLDFDALRLIAMVVREPDPELVRQSLWPVRSEYQARMIEAGRKIVREQRRLTLGSPVFSPNMVPSIEGAVFQEGVISSGRPDCRFPPTPRQDIQAMPHPGMRYDCRSPWSFARILASGKVLLCNTIAVGDLHHESFEEIWYGARADAVRRQVLADTKLCDACDYYRFCLSSKRINYDDMANFFSGNLLQVVDQINFHTGSIPKVVPPPKLIGAVEENNIVYWDGRFFGIPRALGPLDLTTQDVAAMPGVIVANTEREVRRFYRDRAKTSAAQSH